MELSYMTSEEIMEQCKNFVDNYHFESETT